MNEPIYIVHAIVFAAILRKNGFILNKMTSSQKKMNRSAIRELEIESLRALFFFRISFLVVYCRKIVFFSFLLFTESFNSEGHSTAWIKHKHDDLFTKCIYYNIQYYTGLKWWISPIFEIRLASLRWFIYGCVRVSMCVCVGA